VKLFDEQINIDYLQAAWAEKLEDAAVQIPGRSMHTNERLTIVDMSV